MSARPRVALTLLVRDEADIIGRCLDFHIAAGIDTIIVTDNGSTDGTADILRRYAEAGRIVLRHEPSRAYRQDVWATRMAISARDEFGAEWVLSGDADEFWWVPGGTIHDALAGAEGDAIACERRNMVCAVESLGDSAWWRQLVYRATPPVAMEPLDDIHADPLPAPFFCLDLSGKFAFRTRGLRWIERGAHAARYDRPWRAGTSAIAVYHFPIRAADEFARSVERIGTAIEADAALSEQVSWKYRRWLAMTRRAGSIRPALHETMPDAEALRRGIAEGTISTDTTIRDQLETLGGTAPSACPAAAATTEDIPMTDKSPARAMPAFATILLIAGMHRSGTSALTGALTHLGGLPPKTLMPANFGNPSGYFESSVVSEANDALLAALGSRWDDVQPVDCAALLERPEGEAWADRLLETLREEYDQLDMALVKDPRITRLMPVWTSMADRNDLDLAILVPIRDPLEVAASLRARDGTPLQYGLLMWLRSTLEVERESRGRNRLYLRYDDLMDDWRRVASRIAERFGFSWPTWTTQTGAEVDAFLSGGLRTQRVAPDAALSSAAVPDAVKECYRCVLDLVAGGEGEEQRARLDKIRGEFDAACAFLGPALAACRQASAIDARRLREAASRPAARSGPSGDLRPTELHGGDLGARRASERSLGKADPGDLPGSIATCELFDAEWYRSAHPGAAAAGVDPAEYFLEHGTRETHDPGPDFSARAYLADHPDVAEAGMNALLHYIFHGHSEGRGIRPAGREPAGAS